MNRTTKPSRSPSHNDSTPLVVRMEVKKTNSFTLLLHSLVNLEVIPPALKQNNEEQHAKEHSKNSLHLLLKKPKKKKKFLVLHRSMLSLLVNAVVKLTQLPFSFYTQLVRPKNVFFLEPKKQTLRAAGREIDEASEIVRTHSRNFLG